MALYIKPPTGSASFEKLHNFVMKRLAFLGYVHSHSVDEVTNVIEREALTENSECLIEGTVKDKISHFTLRFLCASDFAVQEFFVQSELKLFHYRLKFYDFSNLRHLLQKASKQCQYILSNKCYISKYYKHTLKSVIHVSEAVEFAYEKQYNYIKVHYTSALEFIRDRLYHLHSGYVSLPLKDLKIILLHLFEETVIQGINQMRSSLCMKELNDPRMHYMQKKIKKYLISKFPNPQLLSNKKIIKGCNIANESFKFPLCMLNLYKQLSKHHRLKHMSRVHYTLFLKEIGVSSSDAIEMFMKEYSVPLKSDHPSHSDCTHNWAESERRYIYSIEHLYGMRGACRDYKAHSCHSLQSTYDSEGGCPFITFDDCNLQKSLESQSFKVKDIEDIISKVHRKEYHESCCSYLLHKVKMHQNAKQNALNHLDDKNYERKCLPINFTRPDISFENCKVTKPNYYKNNYSSLPLKITSPFDFYSLLSSMLSDD